MAEVVCCCGTYRATLERRAAIFKFDYCGTNDTSTFGHRTTDSNYLLKPLSRRLVWS